MNTIPNGTVVLNRMSILSPVPFVIIRSRRTNLDVPKDFVSFRIGIEGRFSLVFNPLHPEWARIGSSRTDGT